MIGNSVNTILDPSLSICSYLIIVCFHIKSRNTSYPVFTSILAPLEQSVSRSYVLMWLRFDVNDRTFESWENLNPDRSGQSGWIGTEKLEYRSVRRLHSLWSSGTSWAVQDGVPWVTSTPILLYHDSAVYGRVAQDAVPWWRHQMETFSALLALSVGNSPVPGEFPSQRPVTRSFDAFFDLRLHKRLGKHR